MFSLIENIDSVVYTFIKVVILCRKFIYYELNENRENFNMKRFLVLALALVLTLSLTACGNNGNTLSNNANVSTVSSDDRITSSMETSKPTSSSTPINAATPSDESSVSSQSAGMNLTQIQAGNYSSLQGTWKGVAYAVNPQNGTGEQWKAGTLYSLSVSNDKIVNGDGFMVIQGNTLMDSAGSHPLSFENSGGSLDASLTDQDVAINWDVSFYPKGVTNDLQPNNGVKIDNTKNLIVIWTSNNSVYEVFAQTNTSY
ncbi:MAG: DUF6287 domain-containing protein [Bacillota bacterium]|nr:DUF6287 domain-containing protein [Bacillota bacterium]